MVVLSKIYTRTGDKGETALGDGSRVPKFSARVAAYGTVDETNATVGLARLHARARMIAAQVDRLEAEIDAMNARLTPLRSFILPGGTALAAQMHLCRTVCRRAERLVVELAAAEPVNPEAVKYLNRLSDWFFVAGRIANDDGKADVLWVPGLTRPA
jgi:cob(I)alamin adenosyltransferase